MRTICKFKLVIDIFVNCPRIHTLVISRSYDIQWMCNSLHSVKKNNFCLNSEKKRDIPNVRIIFPRISTTFWCTHKFSWNSNKNITQSFCRQTALGYAGKHNCKKWKQMFGNVPKAKRDSVIFCFLLNRFFALA